MDTEKKAELTKVQKLTDKVGVPAAKQRLRSEGWQEADIEAIFTQITTPKEEKQSVLDSNDDSVYSMHNLSKNWEPFRRRRAEEEKKAYGSIPGK